MSDSLHRGASQKLPNTAPKRVIIDTDPGIDDALALILALRSPEISVEAITTVSGNAHVDQCVRNTFRTLDAVAPAVFPPVARGCDRPLKRSPVAADHVHDGDGLGGISRLVDANGNPRYPHPTLSPVDRHGVDVILDLVQKRPGEITLVALGPLTNVATALERNPEAMRNLREIIIMGGSLDGCGNVTEFAEFNFYADPHAAERVVRSGLPATVVGLDVTHQTRLLLETVERAARKAGTPPARFAYDISAGLIEGGAPRNAKGFYLHDPLAVGVAIDPTFVQSRAFRAHVETEGPTTGMLVAEESSHQPRLTGDGNISGCVAVEADRFVRFFLERVFSG